MATFEIKIEIDWMGEDGSIDDELKHAAVNKIVSNIQKDTIEKVGKLATNKVESMVDAWIQEKLDSFLTEPIKVTDNYGSVKKEFASLDSMLKEKLDEFLIEEVNSKGESAKTCGYGNSNQSRLCFAIDKKAKVQVEALMNGMERDIKSSINRELAQQTQEKISSEVTRRITEIVRNEERKG